MSQWRLPPLNAVRAFEAAARLGSYVAAADELHVTQPAIGRHVKSLEARLNVQLFERTPRGVVLTDDGRRYYEHIHRALEMIADASDDLSSRAKTRWLRVRAVPGFASRFLSGHLSDFRRHHPSIRIALEPNASFASIDPQQTDIGIVYGDKSEFSGELELLVRPAIFPVCSPEFLAKHGAIDQVKTLLKMPLLHEDDGTWWSTWLRANGVKNKVISDVSYASADQILSLSMAGEGIALTNLFLVRQELQRGRLLRLFDFDCVLDSYYLLSANKTLSAEVKAFRQWLMDLLATYQQSGSSAV